jgi:NAD(P)-dependent dehydrogenase (short-subunit alcohol dehydrogenase family)
MAIPCDLTVREQVERLIERVTEHFGRIDILVNNAGSIAVGPLESARVQDFEEAMAIMFWAPVYASLAVLPQMRARRGGRIVNITSIGGKVSVPHLLPYSCAKFAAVALSEGMRTELARDGVTVTTIVPGLMRTGSHLNAEFKGNQAREYLWFSLGAASPLTAISAERAARDIVQATRWGLPERVLSVPANILARVHGAIPELTIPVMSLVNHYLLPSGTDPSKKKGREAERELDSRLLRVLNSLGRSAAEELNQTPVTA